MSEENRGVYQRGEALLTAPPAWAEFAACDIETIAPDQLELFYAPDRKNERPTAKDNREGDAKEICRPCLVRAQCRAHALSAPEPEGVWGGLGEDERALILACNGPLTYQQALELPDRQIVQTRARDTDQLLTHQEIEAVQLDATHKTIRECAAAAGVTQHIMRYRLETARKALGTVSRQETVTRAARLGLIKLPHPVNSR